MDHRRATPDPVADAAADAAAATGGATRAQIERRQRIIDAAARTFLSAGYGAASMDAIAADAHVSKRTLYQHFHAKDQLFVAVMNAMCERLGGTPVLCGQQTDPLHGLTDGPPLIGPPDDVLRRLATRFLTIILSAESIAFWRVVIGESGRFPEIGQAFYENGPREMIDRLAAYLQQAGDAGHLVVEDAERAACRFITAMKEPEHMELCLGVRQPPDEAEIAAMVAERVERFLAEHTPARTH